MLAFLCGFEAIAYAMKRSDVEGGAIALALVRLGLDDRRPCARRHHATMWAVLGAAAFATLRLMFVRRTLGIVVGLLLIVAVVVGSLSLKSQYEEAVLAAAQQGEHMAKLVLHENLPGLFEPAAAEAMFGWILASASTR